MDHDTHLLVISPEQLSFGSFTDQSGRLRILLLMEYDAAEAPWLAPNIQVSLGMSPTEARQMARQLIEQADAAEASWC